MCQIRVALEKDTSKDNLDCQEIWDLLKKDGLMKIMTDIGPWYEKLVQEFVINLSNECNKKGIKEFWKVYVRGWCMNFSPKVINAYLGRSKSTESDGVPSSDKVAREIITNQVQ